MLFLDGSRLSKQLRKGTQKCHYSVTFDCDVESVIKVYAGRRHGHGHVSWITPRMMRTFAARYAQGMVHSIEVWNASGELGGGGVGIATAGSFSATH